MFCHIRHLYGWINCEDELAECIVCSLYECSNVRDVTWIIDLWANYWIIQRICSSVIILLLGAVVHEKFYLTVISNDEKNCFSHFSVLTRESNEDDSSLFSV